MRQKRTTQVSILEPNPVDHPFAEDMERASAFLDEHPEFADWVAEDLLREGVSKIGRHGLTCESALRCGILKQLRGESCRQLAFALRDSATAQRFARVEGALAPGKSALQAAVGSVSAATWERVNGALLEAARSEGVEDGSQVRVDSTVTETDILSPTDSRLLRDAVRVLTRLLETARGRLGPEAVKFHDHRRAAKRRALERVAERYGAAPAKAAFDGGYASKENLDGAKSLGVKHAVFSRKRGLKREDMTPSARRHALLKRFRAGAEACISYLKRCFGLARCRWSGLPRFKAWAQSAVLAHNLLRFARLRPKPA